MKIAKSLTSNIFLAAIAAVFIVWFYPHPETSRYNYEEGRPWNYAQLIAPFDIPVHPDSLTLQRARDTLDAHFIPIYALNQLKADSIVRAIPPPPATTTPSAPPQPSAAYTPKVWSTPTPAS